LAISSSYAIYSINKIGSELESIANRDAPLISTFNEINDSRLNKSIHFERANRFAQTAAMDSDAKVQLQDEISRFESVDETLKNQIERAKNLLNQAIERTTEVSQREQIESVLASFSQAVQFHDELNELVFQVFEALEKGQIFKANAFLADVETKDGEFNQSLGSLISAINGFAESSAQLASQHEKSAFQITEILGILSLVIGLLLSYLLIRNIKKLLGADPSAIKDIATSIASGDLSIEVETKSTKPVGVLLAMITMQNNLRESIERDQAIASENARIKQALDNVSASIMMVDSSNNVIYINHALQALFKHAETEIRREIPDFHADQTVGEPLSKLLHGPTHLQKLQGDLLRPYQAEVSIGNRTMAISGSSVRDENNSRLGTFVAWEDRTSEIAVETEIEQIIVSTQNGNLEQRMDLDNNKGFTKILSMGINQLINTTSQVFDDIASTMHALSKGDLNQKMTGDHSGTFSEVQNNVNATIDSLQEIVRSIRNSTDLIATGSDEISSGNQSLSDRTEQQASSLEETASAMEELTSIVRQNAANAQQANQLSTGARDTAQKGGGIVANAVTAMEEINVSINKIADLVAVIDEIAFQTNLLALNASVEAARAGEQGRGFAVVATEVRNLAQRSAVSAKEIKDLIQDSVEKVGAGSKLVNQSGQVLEEIVTSVVKVGDIIAEITTASEEQASGIDQINKTVTDLDDLTQQNAALAEETSTASVSMNARASKMINQVSYFQLSQDNISSTPGNLAKSVSKKPSVDNGIGCRSAAPSKGSSDVKKM
jgi:methyl-accepting chemotaxis protein